MITFTRLVMMNMVATVVMVVMMSFNTLTPMSMTITIVNIGS